MRRIAVGILAMAVVLALSHTAATAQSAKTRLEDPKLAQLFNEISDQLICQCGCQMVLRVCNHQNCPSALPMRAEIEEKLEAGVAPDSIVAAFVDEHGQKVLSSPPVEGFNLAAWIMPGFAVLVGLALIIHYAGHWVTRRRKSVTEGAPDIDPELRRRIEEELDTIER